MVLSKFSEQNGNVPVLLKNLLVSTLITNVLQRSDYKYKCVENGYLFIQLSRVSYYCAIVTFVAK